MTSLSFATNYTFSEDSSIKSSVLESKSNKLIIDNNNKTDENNIKINENIVIEKNNNKTENNEKINNNQNSNKIIKTRNAKNNIKKENLLNKFINKSKVITSTNKPLKNNNKEKKSTSYIYNTVSELESQKQKSNK